ncbi:MAG TPA: MarR family transcriptional regulator [Egibacteraceae bacterium]|nr:MarR family transcriptional regulator [Egibacteraceae bacterium]
MASETIPPELAHAVARLSRFVERRLSRAVLTLPQYRVLGFLSLGPAAAALLADRLTVSRPTLTGVVDGLVEQGLVARSRDPADRRRVDHTLTPAGRAVLSTADEVVGAGLAALLEPLPATRRAQARAGLEALRDALDIERERRLGGP